MRASDSRISLSQVDSAVVPSGDLQPMTFIAAGVLTSIVSGSTACPRTSSLITLRSLTIDVLAGSEADQRKLGIVMRPERPCDEGQVPATKVVLLLGAPPENVTPGYSVDRRLFM